MAFEGHSTLNISDNYVMIEINIHGGSLDSTRGILPVSVGSNFQSFLEDCLSMRTKFSSEIEKDVPTVDETTGGRERNWGLGVGLFSRY